MKIDAIYVACCKTDFYFTKICIASIRYWNKAIPVYLLKDYSQGEFNTSDLEKVFNVSVLQMQHKQLGPYGKLFLYIKKHRDRIFVIDSDIVWLRDVIPELEAFSEDLVVQGYKPDDLEKEMNQWYFNTLNLKKHHIDYQYPGFLFNAGQLVCNASLFSEIDFDDTIKLKEKIPPEPTFDNTFLCEDQGILNYVIAKKIASGSISYRSYKFFTWGHDTAINSIDIGQNNIPAHFPPLIHWFGKKNGLISGLAGNKILRFYEKYYYSKLDNGEIKRFRSRLFRTIKHPVAYIKIILKKMAYLNFL